MTGTTRAPRPQRAAHTCATESNHMTRLHPSASAPHHAIPTHRVLSTPEILQRIQAMYTDRDENGGPAGTDDKTSPL